MDLSGIQPQILISVVSIVSAAIVALLVDFLRNRNEQLRVATAELRVRQQNEAPDSTAKKVMPTPEVAAPPPVVRERPPALPDMPLHSQPRRRRGVRPEDMQRAQERAAELTSTRGRREHTPPPIVGDDATREALNEWLIRRASARAAHKMDLERKQAQPEAAPVPVIAVEIETPVEVPVVNEAPLVNFVEEEKEIIPEPMAVAPEPVAGTRIESIPEVQGNSLPEVMVDSFLWESLFAQSQPAEPVAPRHPFEVIQGMGVAADSGLPRGMQDQSVLARLLDSRKPFSGLVVSIGVNENDGRQIQNADLLASVADYAGTLLSDSDFGCRTGDDEFVLVCPGEVGADAQRRLSQISERLFDFQLRGIGSFSILFSTGGVDVDQEPLADALAGAEERMSQTRRSRKTITLQSVRGRAAAV